MASLPSEVIGDAHTSTYAWELLEDLVDIGNRMGGQPGEREGALRMRDAYADLGFRDVEVTEFEIDGWWRGSTTLSVTGDRPLTFEHQHQVLALPGTPSGSVAAPVVDVGYGRPEDFEDADVEGAIALASSRTPDSYGRWIHRMEKYAAAVDHGAAGFLFRGHLDGNLPPTGEVGYHNRPAAVPAAGVSKEVGTKLLRHVERDDAGARLEVDCRNDHATSQNVEAVLGPETEAEVLVTGHVDAHDIAEGARDNGVGTVLTAEVGRLLSAVAEDLGTAVRLVSFGCEEIGLVGAYHWADTHDTDDVRAIVNIDGAGYGRTLRVNDQGFDAPGRAAQAVSEALSVPVERSSHVSPHGDQWAFVERGVPGVFAKSTQEAEGRGWGHTHADTLDKIDPRDLRHLAVGIASLVLKLTQAEYEPTHTAPDNVRKRLDEGYETELRVSGRWHWDE